MGNFIVCESNRYLDCDNDDVREITEVYKPCNTHDPSKEPDSLVNAVKVGHVSCVVALIKAGADVNTTNNLGQTAFNYHQFKPFKDHSLCLRLVLQAGADVNVSDNYGGTPLHTAAENNHCECVNYILQAGADVNEKDAEGRTPLALAALKGGRSSLNLLIKSGGDVKNLDKTGNTALINAARSGYYRLVDSLIQAGADVNKANQKGFTALMLSPGAFTFFERDGVICLQLLLAAGAYVNKTNNTGLNALEFYLVEGRRAKWQIIMLLYAAGEIVDSSKVGTPYWYRQQCLHVEFEVVHFLVGEEVKFSLQHKCRQTIRKCLLDVHPNLNLFGRVPHLGLPSMLASYLLYGMSLEKMEGDINNRESSDSEGSDS